MKKLLVILFVIGLFVFLTWDNEKNKLKRKEMFSRLNKTFSYI